MSKKAPTLIELDEQEAQPQPKVGSAEYDWSTHYDTKDLYIHTFPNGTVVGLKSFKSIFSKTWLLKMQELETNLDVQLAALRRAACPTALEVLLDLPDDDPDNDYVDQLYEAWTSAGTAGANNGKGLTPGE